MATPFREPQLDSGDSITGMDLPSLMDSVTGDGAESPADSLAGATPMPRLGKHRPGCRPG